MTSRVTDMLADLRRRLRRGIVLRGVCWTLAVLLGGLAMAAAGDVWLHIDHGWLRLALLEMVLGATALTAYRQLWRPLTGRWDDETLALLIERTRPALRDRLASAVALSTTADASLRHDVSLRQRAVVLAESSLDPSLARQLPQRWLPACGGGALCAVLLALGVWLLAAPESLGLALERQWQPFGGPDWPRSTVLMLLDERLEPLTGDDRRWPAEEPLTVYVANRKGALPDDLLLEARSDDQSPEAVAWTPTTLRDSRGREQAYAVATLTPKPGRLSLRPRGGDDDTQPWRMFEVRPAPRLEQFEIEIVPPSYTGLPTWLEQRSAAHVEGVVGSVATLRARANVPLAGVQLYREGEPPQPLNLDGDRQGCSVELTITVEGRSSFWFELRDEYNVASTRPIKYELRGRRDQPPQVAWEHPATDLDVTANAVLPLAVRCSDDFGLAEVRLLMSATGQQTTPASMRLSPIAPSELPLKSLPITWDWSLDSLDLPPGARVEFHIEAVDNRDPDPQSTASRTQSLRIVTAEEKRREIAGLQAGMAQLIERVGSQLEQVIQQRRELETQWSITGQLRDVDRQSLDEVEQQPRRSLADLTDSRVGLAIQIERVRDELRWNRLEDAPTLARMQRLTAHLQPLVTEQLPQLRQHVAQLHAMLAGPLDSATPANTSADPAAATAIWLQVTDGHAVVQRTLTAMSAEVQEWRQRLDTARMLEELLATQQQLRNETVALGSQTLSRVPEDLSAQRRADLSRLADRQRGMADSARRMQSDGSVTGDDNNSADALPSEITDGRLLAWMRQAADFVAANQLGQAGEQQTLILQSLAAALDQQGSPTGDDPQQQSEWLNRLRSTVDELRRRQTDLQRQTGSLRPMSADHGDQEQLETLRKQHAEFTQDLEALAARLQRQLLTTAANAAGRAAAQSRGAEQALAQSRREEAVRSQQQSLEELTRLDEELSQEQQRAEQRQQAHLLLLLSDALPPLRDGMVKLADETAALEVERATAGRWGRGPLKRLQTVTTQQRQAVVDLRALEARSTALELVQTQLHNAAAELDQATTQLSARNTGTPTTTQQRDAAARLDLLITALQPPAGDSTPATGSPQSDSPAAESNFVELRLLRTLQADLLRRTDQWRQQSSGREPTPEEVAVLQRLADEQVDLGERAAKLWQKLHSPADSPSG